MAITLGAGLLAACCTDPGEEDGVAVTTAHSALPENNNFGHEISGTG